METKYFSFLFALLQEKLQPTYLGLERVKGSMAPFPKVKSLGMARVYGLYQRIHGPRITLVAVFTPEEPENWIFM